MNPEEQAALYAEVGPLPIGIAAEVVAFVEGLSDDAAIWAWLDGDGAA